VGCRFIKEVQGLEQELLQEEEQQPSVSIKDLLEAGAHFGHQQYRWNPKMKRFVFEKRNGLYIIDLAKTMAQLRLSIEVIRKTVQSNKTVLFVGTKKQAKNVIKDAQNSVVNFMYVNAGLEECLPT
jgi:small subunit ribosomal protein S2